MENEEISKYLTEKMGLCWHPNATPFGKCPDCGLSAGMEPINYDRINFFTWQGFGMLWDWTIKQDWWWEFILNFNCGMVIDEERFGMIVNDLINPEAFAVAIYNYLKESE